MILKTCSLCLLSSVFRSFLLHIMADVFERITILNTAAFTMKYFGICIHLKASVEAVDVMNHDYEWAMLMSPNCTVLPYPSPKEIQAPQTRPNQEISIKS